MDRLLCNPPDSDNVVAVNGDAGYAVSFGAIAEVFVRLDYAGSVGMRLPAVLNDKDDWKPIARGQGSRFVPESEGGKAVVGEGDYNIGFAESWPVREDVCGTKRKAPAPLLACAAEDGRLLGNSSAKTC